MTVQQAMERWDWRAIRNCPGRYVLKGVSEFLEPSAIAGSQSPVIERRSDAVKDAIIIIELDDGALLSYKREDGTYLHTLNTREGLSRKLESLGITI